MGATDVVGAVSFHGGLTNFSVSGVMNHPLLVLSGGEDDTGSQVEDLEGRLNEANAVSIFFLHNHVNYVGWFGGR